MLIMFATARGREENNFPIIWPGPDERRRAGERRVLVRVGSWEVPGSLRYLATSSHQPPPATSHRPVDISDKFGPSLTVELIINVDLFHK